MEVIVVDDVSTDTAQLDYLDSLGSYLPATFALSSRVVRNTKRKGDAGTRNVCSDFASGEFLLFLDSDNVAKPNMVCEHSPQCEGS